MTWNCSPPLLHPPESPTWILAVLPALEQQLCLPSWPCICLKLLQQKLITSGDSFLETEKAEHPPCPSHVPVQQARPVRTGSLQCLVPGQKMPGI